MVAPTVGIIANPASGRDVRRFVAHSMLTLLAGQQCQHAAVAHFAILDK